MHQATRKLLALGPKSRAVLANVGVRTLAELNKVGPVPAYIRARQADSSVSLNFLYGLVACIEGCDWREVQRSRKLELLNAIESYEKRRRRTRKNSTDELSRLRNIGKAMRKDFELLGISSVRQLARCDADKLYGKIQELTGTRHDPCVWDTYAAAIHQAKSGEALPWWDFTHVRKEREARGTWLRKQKRSGAK